MSVKGKCTKRLHSLAMVTRNTKEPVQRLRPGPHVRDHQAKEAVLELHEMEAECRSSVAKLWFQSLKTNQPKGMAIILKFSGARSKKKSTANVDVGVYIVDRGKIICASVFAKNDFRIYYNI